MDLAKLRKALGLAEDTPEEKVFEAVIERMSKAGEEDKAALATITGQLEPLGLKLDQGKIVKLATNDDNAPENETPREKELRERLDARDRSDASTKLAWAKKQAEQLSKDGKVPPAIKDKVAQLLSIVGKPEALSLAQDGSTMVKTLTDVSKLASEIFEAMPSLLKSAGLSTFDPEAASDETKKAEALETKGVEIARRLQGRDPKTGAKLKVGA